jgi:DeoR/GlpR family transcriptional regulator of sugar metabolism
LIVREHGGAYIKDFAGPVETLTTSHTENLPQKRAIGELAASFVEINDSLIIDSGSTTTEFARCLAQKRGLTVVTNALNIALILGAEPSNEVMMTGGRFKAPTLSLTGETAAELFPRINADKLFLATRGFSLESGLTYPGFSDLPVKKAMIESAKTIYLLADSSKIGLTAFASLGELDKVDVFDHRRRDPSGADPRTRGLRHAGGDRRSLGLRSHAMMAPDCRDDRHSGNPSGTHRQPLPQRPPRPRRDRVSGPIDGGPRTAGARHRLVG